MATGCQCPVAPPCPALRLQVPHCHNRLRGLWDMLQLQSAFGVLALLAIAWALGESRRAVSWRQMAAGLVVTVLTALVLIKLPLAAKAFGAMNDAVNTI